MGTILRVLIADHSDYDYSQLTRLLMGNGFEPLWLKVQDTESFTTALDSGKWDLIICDDGGDGLNGTDILKIFTEKRKAVPIIVLSEDGKEGVGNGLMQDRNCYRIRKEMLPQLLPVVIAKSENPEDGTFQTKPADTNTVQRKPDLDILEELDEVYLETDLSGNITFLKPSFCRLLQYTREELLGTNLRTLMDTETAERVERTFQHCLATGNQVRCVEFELVQKAGTKCWFEASAAPIRDAEGAIVGLRGIGRDISARKDIETEILRSLKVESVGILAGGIAHDFNNLLSVILGYISIARTLIDPEEEAALMLKKAEKAGFQATELTKRLITFSRGDEPWRKLTFLTPLLKRAADFSLVGTAVRFSYLIPDDLWPVNIDEGQIWQVIRNLVMNAGEAMPAGGIITVTAENVNIDEFTNLPLAEGSYVRWSVADQGTGIPTEHLPRIFDPYFTTKGMGPKQGMGLGLAICFSIIRKHGGFITVDSKPGTGTAFYIYLPAFPTKSQQDAAIVDSRLTRKYRILVMDDEEDIRDIFSKLLTHLGYDAELAEDGNEAVAKFRIARDKELPFSAVILDLTVKNGLGGKLTLKKLLQIEPDLKAIITTSYADDPIVTRYRYYGFAAALVKPFTLRELQDSLNTLLSEKGIDDLPLFQQ